MGGLNTAEDELIIARVNQRMDRGSASSLDVELLMKVIAHMNRDHVKVVDDYEWKIEEKKLLDADAKRRR